ncbi:MAG: tetratricopeptide repeat protein [Sphingobacteriales bacterium]|nr:MAG: tetratricopeptide repeat protein [Sphingobacteriales bacterium]
MKKLIILFAYILISISLNSQTIEFQNGNAKFELGDYQGAIQDYNKAIVINPKFSEVYCARRILKFVLGNKRSGCLDLSKAGELGNF